MKEIRITAILILSCISLAYAQDLNETKKVESPFRLLRGVVLKNDFRMTASIPTTVTLIEGRRQNGSDFQNNQHSAVVDNKESSSIWLRISLLNQDNIAQPAIIMDDVLINENSQRLNVVQFPFAFFNRVNGF
ncbi:MAG: hypothetical protein AAGC45_13350 [Bacteroidota bacterium]